jgi:hypothetical protein
MHPEALRHGALVTLRAIRKRHGAPAEAAGVAWLAWENRHDVRRQRHPQRSRRPRNQPSLVSVKSVVAPREEPVHCGAHH